jgi:tetratricopeptide (TPR) repeat protein
VSATPLLSKFTILLLLISFLGCSKETHITTQSTRALEAYTTGVTQWEKFYYSEAVQAFDEAIHLDSNFAMAWARRAFLDEATQNRAKAKEDMDRALALLSSVTPFEQMFIRLQNYRLSYANKRAADLADSMLHLFPEEKEIYLIKGGLYELSKNFEDAIRAYERAIEIDTSYAIAIMSLGYAYSTTGQQAKAVDQMEHYIRLVPDAADPRASFADILLRIGRYDDALEQYQKSLLLKPDYWYSANQIGTIYMTKGRLKAADEQFHKAIAALPQSPQLKANHLAVDGHLNLLRGLYKEAAQQYRDALSLDSTNAEAAYGLLNAFRKLKDLKHAVEVLGGIRTELMRRNLLQSQYMLGFYLAKSRLLLDKEDIAGARTACDSALEFSTPLSRGPVFRQIAEINLRQQDYEDAFDACEEALRVNPNSPEPLFTLVKVYHAKGDAAMTKGIGGRLLEFWKDADPDFLNLRELQQMLGTRRTPSSASSLSPMIAARLD